MRPQSIVNFERALLLLIVLGLVGTVFAWDATVAEARRNGLSSNVVMVLAAVSIGIYALLLWLIARRGSVVAKWVYVVLTAIGLAFAAMKFGDLTGAPLPVIIMQVAQYVLSIVSVWLLFRSDAQAWFRRDSARTH